jgi:protocatechuate 3,4-dioxygenase beta subunit
MPLFGYELSPLNGKILPWVRVRAENEVLLTSSEVTFNLAGHIRHQGLPVQNVLVHVYDVYQQNSANGNGGETPVAEQRTGTRGEFNFAVRSGLYRLEVSPDSSTRFLKQSISEARVMSNTNCNINLTTGCILSGKVTAHSGEPVRRCEVVALGIEPSSYKASAKTDEEGHYSLILPRGKYHVAARAIKADFAADDEELEEDLEDTDEEQESFEPPMNTDPSHTFVSTTVQVMIFGNDDELDLVLPPLVPLDGEVHDIFGQPVAHAHVSVAPSRASMDFRDKMLAQELNLTGHCFTDSLGRFRALVSPGHYDVSIEPDDGALLFSTKETGLTVGESVFQKFTVSEGHRLRGQVLYEDEPISQALVRIRAADRKTEFLARTDAQGQFSAAVPGGNYKLVVTAHPKDAPTVIINDQEHNGLAPWTRMIVVGGDTHVAVKIQNGTALQGRVSDEQGQARPGVRVSVYSDSEKQLDADKSRALASGITDGDGRYCIFLSPGSYWLVVHKDFVNARMVEISNEPVNVDITWHGWCQVRFEVQGEDGYAVPRCRVSYAPYGNDEKELADDDDDGHEFERQQFDQSGMPRGYYVTPDDGICRLTLPSGVYIFRFSPPLDGSYEAKVIRQLSISADLTKKITLSLQNDSIIEELSDGTPVS